MKRPKPLFIGEPDETREEVVWAFTQTIPDRDGVCPIHEPGEFPCDWVIAGKKYVVVTVSVGPAEWRFAVFEDGPYFKV